MNQVRYVLHPGPITSKSDGQVHFINAQMLARLYGVSLSVCVQISRGFQYRAGDIHLRPQYDGDYTLPTK